MSILGLGSIALVVVLLGSTVFGALVGVGIRRAHRFAVITSALVRSLVIGVPALENVAQSSVIGRHTKSRESNVIMQTLFVRC
jgi:hypothetical protein